MPVKSGTSRRERRLLSWGGSRPPSPAFRWRSSAFQRSASLSCQPQGWLQRFLPLRLRSKVQEVLRKFVLVFRLDFLPMFGRQFFELAHQSGRGLPGFNVPLKEALQLCCGRRIGFQMEQQIPALTGKPIQLQWPSAGMHQVDSASSPLLTLRRPLTSVPQSSRLFRIPGSPCPPSPPLTSRCTTSFHA